MSEEVKPEVIKKTQDVLGKFIKKPTLTEKLLKKPPFRFLHDICTSVMKDHGFLEGVLNSPEDRIENIKVKEEKIKFLQKVITAVEMANGTKLSVKPSKIVAGLEASKTNELLQALGKALEKQQVESRSSKSKLTKSKSNKKVSKEVKEEPPDKKKKDSSKVFNKIVENGVYENKETHEYVSRPVASPKRDLSKKIEEPPLKINDETFNTDKFEEQNINTISVEKRKEVEKPNISGDGESKDVPNIDFINVSGSEGQGDHNDLTKKEVIRNSDLKKGNSGKFKHRRLSIQNLSESPKVEVENSELLTGDSDREKVVNDKIHILNKSETILKEQNRAVQSPTNIMNSKTDTYFGKEGILVSRPRTGIRPSTARPASARPAAPRIRDKGEVTVMEEVIKPASGKVHVIEDKDTSNDIEEENLIMLETTNDVLVGEQKIGEQTEISSINQEHGHLVEQILEAQRELEDDSRFSDPRITAKTEIEWDSNKNRDIENGEIEKLRVNIQTLTRKANPLGKLLDFFQEDIDTVTKELNNWKEKNSSLSIQIAHEKSITDQYVEPLKIHLKELQQSIDEQLEKISIVKSNIIKNNEKIHKLLTGIN